MKNKEEIKICQIPKCKRVQHSIGWCKVHYKLIMPNCNAFVVIKSNKININPKNQKK